MGTVDGRGYDGQQEDAILDVQSTFKSVFLLIPTAQMPRSRDLAIFVVIIDA